MKPPVTKQREKRQHQVVMKSRGTTIAFSKKQFAYFQRVYRQRRLADQIISVTGYVPLNRDEMEEIIKNKGGFIGGKGIWQCEQMVVIGRDGFDVDYLQKSVQIGLNYKFSCNFLSQEAFLDILENDRYPSYYKGDPRIQDHQGLSYVATLGFPWPSAEVTIGIGGTGNLLVWNDSHPLRSRYGYNVQRETPESERLSALKIAVRQDALGLREVAEHIAWLIRLAKRRRDDKMDEAIDNWESDLEWLYKEYYENSVYSFIWPSG
jgi:hypothetical protein